MHLSKVCFNVIQKHLISKIRFGGPITVSEYMKTVLTTPTGFYMKQDVFGKHGHFVTSPEISQIFGELVAIWIIHEWQRFGRREPLCVVEFGPGKGTLMSDICRVLTKLGCHKENTQIHLIEISPHLKQIQTQTLCGLINSKSSDKLRQSKFGPLVSWYNNIDDIPISNGFEVYIANEFLDALPIHKFQKDSNGEWKEILIDVDENDSLRYIISHYPTPASRTLLTPEHHSLDHVEISAETFLLLEKLVVRLNRYSGCALICDYGFDTFSPESRDTFRAFKHNKPWDPLKTPGEADLTADVDFHAIKEFLKERAITFGPINQASYLNNMGLGIRLRQLLEKADDQDKVKIIDSVNTIFSEMGERFKFLSIYPKNSKHLFPDNPPGFFDICLNSEP